MTNVDVAEHGDQYLIGNGNEVVFVDDCEQDLVLARICFRRSGAANPVLTFTTATAFVAFMKDREADHGPQPALVFLDINMPEMNGFETLTWLKQDAYFRSVPVVFMLTNSENPADKDTAKQLGAMDCIVKPTSPRELVSILQQLRV